MSEVIRMVAHYALVSQCASILEAQGHRVSGDICLAVPAMVSHFGDWTDQVLPELSILATDTWAVWLETGYDAYGEDLAQEMYHAICGTGGARESDCTQYVRGGCMPYLPDLGYLVACCACE
jgi:hypothetical protein